MALRPVMPTADVGTKPLTETLSTGMNRGMKMENVSLVGVVPELSAHSQEMQSNVADDSKLHDAPGGRIPSDAILASALDDCSAPGDRPAACPDTDYAPKADLEPSASGLAELHCMAMVPEVDCDAGLGDRALQPLDTDETSQDDDIDLDADTLILGERSPGPSTAIFGELTDAEVTRVAAENATLQRHTDHGNVNSSGAWASTTTPGGNDDFDLVPQSKIQFPNDASAPCDSMASTRPLDSELSVAAPVGDEAKPREPVVKGAAFVGQERTFAGRRIPKNEKKHAFFIAMQRAYFTVVYEMRYRGMSVDPNLSPHIRCGLQQDFWKYLKEKNGVYEDSSLEYMLVVGQKWALERFINLCDA